MNKYRILLDKKGRYVARIRVFRWLPWPHHQLLGHSLSLKEAEETAVRILEALYPDTIEYTVVKDV